MEKENTSNDLIFVCNLFENNGQIRLLYVNKLNGLEVAKDDQIAHMPYG